MICALGLDMIQLVCAENEQNDMEDVAAQCVSASLLCIKHKITNIQ